MEYRNVKKLLPFILTGILLSSSSTIQADVETEDVGPQNTPVASNTADGGPFTAHVYGDWIGASKVRRCGGRGNVHFATGEAELSFIFYYNECHQEGLNLTLSYQNTYLNWKNNPFFGQTDYNTVSVVLGGFSKRACDWLWQAQAAANFDNVEHWDWDDYMNYDLLLWGRYDWSDTIGLHIGVLAQTGMKIDRVYPIVGIDWRYSQQMKLSLVFPVNISATYNFTPCWSIALAGRFFDQRHRVGKNATLSKGLWSYRTAGGELALNYAAGKWLEANIHGGYSMGGRIKIADRGYHNRKRYRFDGAPYAGADISMKF